MKEKAPGCKKTGRGEIKYKIVVVRLWRLKKLEKVVQLKVQISHLESSLTHFRVLQILL